MSKLNILIPMAGAGSRFKAAGYKDPKPFIKVGTKRMIEVVVNNIKPTMPHRFIFLVQQEHIIDYAADVLLCDLASNVVIVPVDGVTEGAACTALLAKDFINNDEPLLLANSDQWVDFNIDVFLMRAVHFDGYLLTMPATGDKWSYVKRDANGFINKVVEKVAISSEGTCGVYFWKKGSDFVRSAESMINKNLRHNNEFYVAPTFNELIAEDKLLEAMIVADMHGLGTPEDLDKFLQNPDLVKIATEF